MHSCHCGAVYAVSDVAKFIQHLQKCNRGSKSGEGERAKPKPRGDRGRPSASAEVGGEAEGKFQCHICFGTFSKKANLKKHLKTTVSCKRKVSVEDIEDVMERAPKDSSSECPQCGTVVSTAVMSRHINSNCPERKSAKPKARAQPVDPNVSRDSVADRAENLEIIEAEVISDEQFLNQLKEFMADENRGNLAESTTGTYIMRLDHYGRYWRKENPNFSFGKLCIFGSKACLDPPSTARWESKLGSAQARSQGLSAFLKMLEFLREQLRVAKDRGLITDQTFWIRQSHLSDSADETRTIRKRVEKLKEQEKMARDGQSERLAQMEEHSKFLDELVTWTTPDDNQLPDVELNKGDVEEGRFRVKQQEQDKPKSSKGASSRPKRQKREVESESEESEESNNLSDFSDEDSD